MLVGLDLWMIALLSVVGVLLDLAWGETRRWHPLVGFGRCANALERYVNRGQQRALRGCVAWCMMVAPGVLLAIFLTAAQTPASDVIHALLLYFCIGLRSLRDHALPIGDALQTGNLDQARVLTARIVSRDTADADATALAKAGVESLLENGNDAVFGTLFWFIVAGAPGAVLFRLANTLDAMWGYRSERFHAFGWAAARIDDGLNWIPARLTALCYVLLASSMADKRRAWSCWRAQAPAWSSPNAGPVMASGAGALGLSLGGAAIYDGVREERPPLGAGRDADAADIGRAWRLVAGTTVLWLVVLASAAFLNGMMNHA